MKHLFEAVQITPAIESEILHNPHIHMGFEVEFVYVASGITSQTQAFTQAQQDLTQLGLSFGSGSFKLMPDTSIDTAKQPNHFGIELVSPPLPLQVSLQYLKQVFDWMQELGHETNFSTGLHVNVSVSNLPINQVDKLKLLLLLDEAYVQGAFDRLMNSYTQSHVEILKQAISQSKLKKQPWTQLRDFQKIKHVLNTSIDLDKYRTVNFSKLSQGYLEFRIMGNKDYHKRFPAVKRMIIRYAHVLLAALDPDAFVPEYNQALAHMFAAGLNSAQPMWPDLSHKYASVGASNKPQEQLKMLDYIQRARKALSDNNVKAAVRLITMVIEKADAHSYSAVKSDLINAAAISYRILIHKLFGWDVNQFVKAQSEAGVKPDVIKKVKTYLQKF
jgi:hypothetical protein